MQKQIKRLNKLEYIGLLLIPVLVVIVLPIVYQIGPIIIPNISIFFPDSSCFLPGLGFLFLLTNNIFSFIFYSEMWKELDKERYCEIRDTFPLAFIENKKFNEISYDLFIFFYIPLFIVIYPLMFFRRLSLLFRLSNEYILTYNDFVKQHDLIMPRFRGILFRVYPLFLVANVIVGIVSPFSWDEEKMVWFLVTVSTITYIMLLVVVWQVCTAVNRLADEMEMKTHEI